MVKLRFESAYRYFESKEEAEKHVRAVLGKNPERYNYREQKGKGWIVQLYTGEQYRMPLVLRNEGKIY